MPEGEAGVDENFGINPLFAVMPAGSGYYSAPGQHQTGTYAEDGRTPRYGYRCNPVLGSNP